jgi:general stress protein 26
MLAVDGAGSEMQPMTAFVRRGEERIVIFTGRDTEIGRAGASHGHISVVGKNHDYHAYLEGDIRPIEDRQLTDELWNPTVAAWYPDGKEDPNLLLIEFRPQRAEIWASIGNPLVFGYKIAKANATGEMPEDVAVRRSISFSGGGSELGSRV